MALPVDPFAVKQYHKFHPYRIYHKIQSVLANKEAARNFSRYELPQKALATLSPEEDQPIPDTYVTPLQFLHLKMGMEMMQHSGGCIVELGCFRGVTTSKLAELTSKSLYAVDPFIGYGGSEEDYALFLQRTKGFANVRHLRKTSGQAAREWDGPEVDLVFIDALHDYDNTLHDILAWREHVTPGGLLAMHDTDNTRFAGTRRAVYEVSKTMELVAHVQDLVILRKSKG
ncbi:MAG: class I SAM-dependent methyltransferase [Candidatus Sumerlaeia bacterium]|nr:class I SAM-dependent methyltransferase [Candidatus Sumerlaeia bacterium]